MNYDQNSYPFDEFPPRQQTTPPPCEPAPERRGWTAGKVIALALCCSLVGGILGGLGVSLLSVKDTPREEVTNETDVVQIVEGNRQNAIIDVSAVDTSKKMTAAEVYAVNVGSTVGITTSVTTNFWGYQTTSAASGSGFIYSADGYILTNYHVVEDSNAITVALYDGTTYDATLIGFDESNDIAVLKVEAAGLVPVVLGDSDNLNVGDEVVAIGNPLGELTFSLTAGTISALNRSVTMSNGVTMNLMQTDCAINSGNSGGALFNLYGEVIGITNAKYSSSSTGEASIDNIGFAIPLNSVRKIVDSVIEKGYISKPYVGISVSTVSSEMERYGLPVGAVVESVTDGGPAAQAGLQVNDIITAVDGQAITSSNDIVTYVGACTPGDEVKFTVYRQGQTLEITITVGENIQSALEQQTQQTQQQQQGGYQGGQTFPWGNWGFGG